MHVQIHWPNEYDTHLWPLALDYATWIYNHTPKCNGLAPIEIFCRTHTGCDYLRHAKVFGAPVYILDPCLQDGKKIPKWEPRSHRGQFLGFSRNHSSNVGLICNLRTGSITPQFHFIVNQKFTTVPGGQGGWSLAELTDDKLCFFIRDHWDTDSHVDSLDSWDPQHDGPKPPLPDEWQVQPQPLRGSSIPDPDAVDRRWLSICPEPTSTATFDPAIPGSPLDITPTRLDFDDLQESDRGDHTLEGGSVPVLADSDDSDDDEEAPMSDFSDEPDDSPVPSVEPPVISDAAPSPPRHYPKCNRKQPDQTTAEMLGNIHKLSRYIYKTAVPLVATYSTSYSPTVARAMQLNWTQPCADPISPQFKALMEANACPLTEELFSIHPFALQIKLNQAKDQPTLQQILNMPDDEKNLWIDSMNVKLAALWNKECFELVKVEAAKGHQITPLTWAFKFKSKPDGTYYKQELTMYARW